MADESVDQVKTPATPEKPIEDRNTLEAIHRLLPEIRETKDKLKTVREQLKDVEQQNEEYQQLKDEISELTTKRQTAKKLLQADVDYQKVSADVDDYRAKLKDLQEIMSHYLVTYYNETQKMQIKDNEGETRQVVLTAKMGKPEADLES